MKTANFPSRFWFSSIMILFLVVLSACSGCPDRVLEWNAINSVESGDIGSASQTIEPDGDSIWINRQMTEPNNQIVIEFNTDPSITWWKQVELLDANCNVISESQLALQDNNHGPITHVLLSTTDPVIYLHFSKAKFLGWHTGMYLLPSNSMIHPGMHVTIYWTKDSH